MKNLLTGSVGKGGLNHSADVVLVQRLLNMHMHSLSSHLKTDGIAGPRTVDAILAFQKTTLGFKHPDGLVQPHGPTWNSLTGKHPVGTVHLGGIHLYGKPLPLPAARVLKQVLKMAHLHSATITRVASSPHDQARIMYDNIVKYGAQWSMNLYKEPGQKVTQVYVANHSKPRDQVISLMEAKILALGPSTVSKHCSNTHYVFDVLPSSIHDQGKFIKAVEAHPSVSHFLQPPQDPVFHIEIPKSNGKQNQK
jgi:hypothetical protein